ncbi:PAS domain-containing protein [Natronomonas halophila]|uniref:hybrid sensor histidine kinase/response regulator n=1 Tax=Natronomonas halophila TaxID=2747817 RepID=UPI0015B6C46D|nr:PAS domain-containing protein [Natronomonas halophila]QLD86855.1 PAS domain-containing protein [Natronomonas halophila]
MARPIRVLHVDDDSAFGDLVSDALEREGDRISVVTETSAEAALGRIETDTPDCIVSDYEMPRTDGIEFLESVRDKYPDLPFILFTGKGSEEVASEAISAGATDYLQKGTGSNQYELLANRVRNAVGQHRSRKRLERERSRMKFALESANAAIWTRDIETDAMEIHPNVCPVFDAPIESFDDFLTEVHPADRDAAEETVRSAAAAGESYSIQFRFPGDDGTRWGEMNGRTIHEDGDPIFQTGITRDITPQKERKRRFETLTSNLPGMVYRCRNEPNWPMEDVRGDVASFTGYTAAELESGEVRWGEDVLHPGDREWIWKDVQSSLEERGSFEVTYRIRTREGETRWAWERGRGIYGPDGDLEALEGFITEITDQKERERRLERQNERFDELASVVSHDLRTPLATARGRLDMAADTGEMSHIEAAQSALDRLDDLREDLAEMLRTGEVVGETEPVDVAAVAEEAWERVNAPEGTRLETVDSPEVEGDPDAVRRLLQNLLSNAVEHSTTDAASQGQKDTVGRGNAGTKIRIGALDDGFYVEDDGPGIPPEDRENVFTPGFSTKPGGTGMGMASVAGVVDAHGWSIEIVDAEELGGARFEIRE